MRKIRNVAMLLMLPVASFAHAGHGHENPLSPGHYLNNLEHAVEITLLVSALIAVSMWFVYRKKKITR